MKIYRAWSESNHKTVYTFGYFLKKENAEKMLKARIPIPSATRPPFGIEEIDIFDTEDVDVRPIDHDDSKLMSTMDDRFCELNSIVNLLVNKTAKDSRQWNKLEHEVFKFKVAFGHFVSKLNEIYNGNQFEVRYEKKDV